MPYKICHTDIQIKEIGLTVMKTIYVASVNLKKKKLITFLKEDKKQGFISFIEIVMHLFHKTNWLTFF